MAGAAVFAALPAFSQSARPDVAGIDRERILADAANALKQAPTPLPSLRAPLSPGTPLAFFSQANDFFADTGKTTYTQRPGERNPEAFTAHRDALFALSREVAALAAAFQITRESRYADHAYGQLRAWFADPATRMTPAMTYAGMIPNQTKLRFEGVLEAVFLAEIAQAIPFLPGSDDAAAVREWFAAYLTWLTEDRLAALARDQKDHHGSSWLLQAAAVARLTGNEVVLSDLRHRFKTVTLRTQIVAAGTFPHELTTPFPYRLSLFNLDMLAAACELLSTRFESLWQFELQDGPGLHVAVARHVPYIQRRTTWPYSADLTFFSELPLRRSALLLAARAYDRPEYAEVWRSLPPDTAVPEIARTLPISQPLLWVARPSIQRS